MRKPIALACLLFAILANGVSAQYPSTCVRRFAAPVQACPNFQKPACRTALTQASACQIQNHRPSAQVYSVVQGASVAATYPAVPVYPMVQGSPVIQSINKLPMQPGSVLSHSTVVQNAQQQTQTNCNCGGRVPSFSPQSGAPTVSILEPKRNPFSLAGHAQEVKPIDYCLQEFLVCCQRGGKNCMLNYYNCAEITGEQMRFDTCPAEAPTVED